MKKFLLLLMLVTLVACNQAEDDNYDAQEWSTDTIPNPEDGNSQNSKDGKSNSQYQNSNENMDGSGDGHSSEESTPFKKEDIAGEWEVNMTVTQSNCNGVSFNNVVKERWFVNFETGELNISVMDKGSKTKEYWGKFTGTMMSAIADKKLTKQEMQLLNEKNTERNSLNLQVENNNRITGKRVDISKELCRTDYTVTMKR